MPCRASSALVRKGARARPARHVLRAHPAQATQCQLSGEPGIEDERLLDARLQHHSTGSQAVPRISRRRTLSDMIVLSIRQTSINCHTFDTAVRGYAQKSSLGSLAHGLTSRSPSMESTSSTLNSA